MIRTNVYELPCTVKKFAVTDAIELSLRIPLSEAVWLPILAEMTSKGARLTLIADQQPLPVGEAPGQMTILDGLGEQTGRVTWYAVRLMEMPKDDAKAKKARAELRKITGMVADDLNAELQSLPSTIAPKVSEVEAVEMKLALEGLGCVVSLEGWPEEENQVEPCCVGNAADPVAHSFDCPTLGEGKAVA